MAHNGSTYVNKAPSGRGHWSGPFGSRRLPSADSVITFTCMGATLLVGPLSRLRWIRVPAGDTVGRAGQEPRPLRQNCAYSQDNADTEPQLIVQEDQCSTLRLAAHQRGDWSGT